MGSSTVRAQQLANEANVQMTRETNESNKQIASDANEWQQRMNEMNNQFNHDEAILQREYDSPINQLHRFADAGLNPTIAFQAANGGATSAAASSGGSGVSPAIPSLQAGHVEPLPSQSMVMLEKLTKVSQILKNIGDESASLAEGEKIRSLLESDLKGADLRNKQQEMAISFDATFGAAMRTMELKRKGAECIQLYNQAYELASRGDLDAAMKATEMAKKNMYAAQAALFGKQTDLASHQIDWFDERMQAELRELASRSNKQNAEAQNAREQAITEEKLRDVRQKVLGADYEKTSSEAEQQKAINKINDVLDKHGLRIKYQFGHYAVEGEKASFEFDKWKRIYRNRDLLDIAVKAYEMELRKANPDDWFTVLDRLESALGSGLTAGAILAK